MGQVVGVVGPSGSGKSTSARNLDPESTYYINVLGKSLPFKGWKTKYNTENKNYAVLEKWDEVAKLIQNISDHRKDITTIVIDDAGFIMQTEFMKRAGETGFGKFNEMGQHMFRVLNAARSAREDLDVIFLFHEDLNMKEGFELVKEIKTVGAMVKNYFAPEALCTILLWTHTKEEKDGTTSYHFVTNKCKHGPAKSPMGMFDELLVPNDLKFVKDKIKEYET